jgi:hypothetical protein
MDTPITGRTRRSDTGRSWGHLALLPFTPLPPHTTRRLVPAAFPFSVPLACEEQAFEKENAPTLAKD